MKRWIAAASAFMCILCGCSGRIHPEQSGSNADASREAAYQKISAEEAKTRMDGDSPYILLDVRTTEEFREAHIAGAVLIPDYEIVERAEAELPEKDALILIYCRSGRRSALAAKDLLDMGYTNVYDFGGIIDWPYETITD